MPWRDRARLDLDSASVGKRIQVRCHRLQEIAFDLGEEGSIAMLWEELVAKDSMADPRFQLALCFTAAVKSRSGQWLLDP